METDSKKFMQMAYEEAVMAGERGEVPVGAVLINQNGSLLARDGNRCIEQSDPCAHAEILVLRAGGQLANNYRLTGSTIYTTLEPCIMCVGAMVHARVERLVFAALDSKAGAVVSCYQIGDDGKLNHKLHIDYGLMADKCEHLLKEFFKAKR